MIAWFLVPYKVREHRDNMRYPAIDDQTPEIRADNGDWSEAEIMGDMCIVKVRAEQTTIDILAGLYELLPGQDLNDDLSGLDSKKKTALVNKIKDLGYTDNEVTSKLGNDVGTKKFGDLLDMMASKRMKPRYDPDTKTIVLDGPVQACKPISILDAEVT